ncbi:RAMP superfamily CRISPR-associated protein [Aerosakkonema sp. BLCC-F183]|uniref:RAMP superfamily CRISPR-associated protein n=1 Tax=Aerosakkonema sp. BLCC-F183 TaxID=3342834 RepID=UPI0035B9D63C
MFKRFVNQCTIELTITPAGPILIKSGKEGADPTKPDMEFVETYHGGGRTIYLPGSSLKGAIRAHAERIVRTVGSDRRPNNSTTVWASDPLSDDKDEQKNINLYLDNWKKKNKNHPHPGAELYKQSCFISQMFGNTAIASRVRIEDAYPVNPKLLKIEERNGVAIDRVFGSVAVGPFNFQVCTAGEFHTKIHLRNFTLAQLGLIGLVLRDLNQGWFGLGFAKSRGLGLVEVKLNSAVVQYPGCIIKDEQISAIGTETKWPLTSLLGAGMFLEDEERNRYGFPPNDLKETSPKTTPIEFNFGVQQSWEGSDKVRELFSQTVEAWCEILQGTAA